MTRDENEVLPPDVVTPEFIRNELARLLRVRPSEIKLEVWPGGVAFDVAPFLPVTDDQKREALAELQKTCLAPGTKLVDAMCPCCGERRFW